MCVSAIQMIYDNNMAVMWFLPIDLIENSHDKNGAIHNTIGYLCCCAFEYVGLVFNVDSPIFFVGRLVFFLNRTTFFCV